MLVHIFYHSYKASIEEEYGEASLAKARSVPKISKEKQR
jgi:hypothetical protein